MVVNSYQFWIFFAAVLLPYYAILKRSGKGQNIWLLLASYFFYGYANWKSLPLLIVVTIVFYFLGIGIEKQSGRHPGKARLWMIAGLILGIGILFYFKYLGALFPDASPILNVVGISFFTFKLLSYVLETYLGKMAAERNFVDFAAYVAFFPTILSGPIDRPGEFIPQLKKERQADWDGIAEGFRRVVWGLFLKLCIADRIKAYPDAVFGNVGYHNTTSIILAAILYAIEMYADFAGYSEMAIGVGRILGFKVRENFLRPFFAQNVSEYWRRWHMSLTSWITDYVYTPLNVAFRNWGKWGLYLATCINVILIGVWHGAQWGFLLFGIWHSIFLVLAAAAEKKRKKFEKKHHLKGKWYYALPRRIVTFIIVACGLVIFRTARFTDLTAIVAQCGKGFGPIFTNGLLEIGTLGLFSILVLFFKEMKDENGWNIHFLHAERTWIRLASMAILFAFVIFAGELNGSSFIYFQF
jgi:D-alanyl-lipoteichoic acid acyltransferase DltB (MBOAT superfamily)